MFTCESKKTPFFRILLKIHHYYCGIFLILRLYCSQNLLFLHYIIMVNSVKHFTYHFALSILQPCGMLTFLPLDLFMSHATSSHARQSRDSLTSRFNLTSLNRLNPLVLLLGYVKPVVLGTLTFCFILRFLSNINCHGC